MTYIQVHFAFDTDIEAVGDILSAQLADLGFESFVSVESGLEAFVQTSLFSEEALKTVLADFPMKVEIDYSFHQIEDKNWNEEWEKHYFNPIEIENLCCIHSSFHQPEGDFQYRILIDPKMSFGTGHHQTTLLMLKEILSIDFTGKSVLDMGCGTAVLAILASMRGANPVLAIDIDEWAFNNTLENIQLNNTRNIDVLWGGAELLGIETFDIIFANINRNILLQDIPAYVNVLNDGGALIMSGFYKEDIPLIRAKCEECSLTFSHFEELDNWVVFCANAKKV
jgi:ribosomal protein L11 methyltransferase